MPKTVRKPHAESVGINKSIVRILKKDPDANRVAIAKQLGITPHQLYNRIHTLRSNGSLPKLEVTGSSPVVDLTKNNPVVRLPASKKPAQNNLRQFRKGRINQYGDVVDELINMAPTKLQAAMELIDKIEALGDQDLIKRAYETARKLAAR